MKNTDNNTEFENSIYFLCSKLYFRFKTAFSKQMKIYSSDITPDQLIVLLSLSKNNAQFQKQIGDNVCKDKPNTTRILDVLEKNGFIERKADIKDRRKFRIFITKKGTELVCDISPFLDKTKDSLAEFISLEDEKFLAKIIEKLEKYILSLEFKERVK